MPPNEPCPHCGELVLDWHNEWYDAAQRQAIQWPGGDGLPTLSSGGTLV